MFRCEDMIYLLAMDPGNVLFFMHLEILVIVLWTKSRFFSSLMILEIVP